MFHVSDAWMFVVTAPLCLAVAWFWIQMLDHCVQNERGHERILWTLITLTGPGMLLYYFFRWHPRYAPLSRRD